MPTSDREQLQALQRSLDDEARPFREAASRVKATDAEDETGVAAVTLGSKGQLLSIRVDASWERVVGVGGLGEAVVAAYRNASIARAEAYADDVNGLERPESAGAAADPGADALEQAAYVDGIRGHGGAEEPFVHSHDRAVEVQRELQAALARSGDQVSDEGLAEGLLSYMEAMEDVVDQMLAQTDLIATTQVEGSSTSGRVRASITLAGEVKGIDFDSSWAPTAHPSNLGREALAAIQDGLRRAAIRSSENSAGRELSRLANDPHSILQHLRLS